MKCKHPSAGPRIQTLDPSLLPAPCSDSNAKNAILCSAAAVAASCLPGQLWQLDSDLDLDSHSDSDSMNCAIPAPNPNSYLWAARLIML